MIYLQPYKALTQLFRPPSDLINHDLTWPKRLRAARWHDWLEYKGKREFSEGWDNNWMFEFLTYLNVSMISLNSLFRDILGHYQPWLPHKPQEEEEEKEAAEMIFCKQHEFTFSSGCKISGVNNCKTQWTNVLVFCFLLLSTIFILILRSYS